MNDLIESIREWPWFWAWSAFFVIVFLRAGATYLLGRGIAAGVTRRREPSARVSKAMATLSRWGAPGVMLSFLTVGAQTAVNLAAGLIQMPVANYLLGLIPGAAIWATVWSTIGMAAFYAVVFYGGRESTAWLVAGLTIVAAVVLVVIAARRRPSSNPLDE